MCGLKFAGEEGRKVQSWTLEDSQEAGRDNCPAGDHSQGREHLLSSLHATTSPTRLAVRQERSGQRSVESLSTSHQFLHSLYSVP